MKSRIETLKESKFNTMTPQELEEVMGGLCISCKKRDRAIEIGFETKATIKYDGEWKGEISGTITF